MVIEDASESGFHPFFKRENIKLSCGL